MKMQCMTYEPSPSLIPRVVYVVDIGKEVMNIMELVIQVLKPCAVHVMCILSHVKVLKLVQNHSLKLGVCRSSILIGLYNSIAIGYGSSSSWFPPLVLAS